MIDTKLSDGFRHMGECPEFTVSQFRIVVSRKRPEPLCKAVRELRNEGKILKGDVRVKLVRDCDRINGAPKSTVIEHCGLGSTVEVAGLVPQKNTLEIVRRCHLGLLLALEQLLQSLANGEHARVDHKVAFLDEFEVSAVVRRLSAELDKLCARDNGTV